MTQPKSKLSKSKSKKTTAASSKKVKRATSAKSVDLTPAPRFGSPAPIFTAPVPVLAAVVEAPLETKPTRTLTRAEFLDLVRKEAYRRAARRDFKNGSPFQDWVNAEASVSGKLAAEGVRLS